MQLICFLHLSAKSPEIAVGKFVTGAAIIWRPQLTQILSVARRNLMSEVEQLPQGLWQSNRNYQSFNEAWQWESDGWDIKFSKLCEHSTFVDPRCHVCTRNTSWQVLPPTVNSAMADHRCSMSVTRIGKRHWLW